MIIADTSALYAAFDSSQPEHVAASMVLDLSKMVISPLVLTELDHLVHRDLGFPAAMEVIEALTDRMADGQYKLAELKHTDLTAAAEVRAKYDSLRLDLADCIGVVLADRYRTNEIFTLDQRDYRAITPLTPGLETFRVLPADM
jgi:uncharacterized protein